MKIQIKIKLQKKRGEYVCGIGALIETHVGMIFLEMNRSIELIHKEQKISRLLIFMVF